ncbi:uncharacterized protein FA14DRAFT_8184 [Meira miltonrushii]|uniref:Uncharacterized protein n=1 Tax=Meira miltonrushii TaxID=1280837 RepID=A0A316VMZ8_9BASI|nr:uncharacterized protein FA14DRAFT_8184 [Meira miltonrushii]PWN36935.1 hypothetical protein FA14DRAFT_8184 [Meira miltonrushii]
MLFTLPFFSNHHHQSKLAHIFNKNKRKMKLSMILFSIIVIVSTINVNAAPNGVITSIQIARDGSEASKAVIIGRDYDPPPCTCKCIGGGYIECKFCDEVCGMDFLS